MGEFIGKFHDIEFGNDFLDITLKAQAVKIKQIMWFIKIQNFLRIN
jgi:hypothetical protein